MPARSHSSSTTSVILRIAGSVGATLLILLTLIAIIRPDMIDMSAMMHRLAATW